MADKQISELPVAEKVTDETLLPVFQPGSVSPAQQMTGKQFREFGEATAAPYAALAQTAAETAQNALVGIREAVNNIPEGETPIVNDLTTGGATAALSAEMGKLLNWIEKGTSIPSNADLGSDTYKVPGKYYCGSGSTSATLVDSPVTNDNFVMFVFRRTTGSSLTQLIITLNGALYIRGSSANGDLRKWNDKPNLSEVVELIEEAAAALKAEKPSGSYTGNADAAERTINVGGTYTNASLLSVACPDAGYTCLIGRNGGFGKFATGEIFSISQEEVRYKDGNLIVKSNADHINGNREYYYERL